MRQPLFLFAYKPKKQDDQDSGDDKDGIQNHFGALDLRLAHGNIAVVAAMGAGGFAVLYFLAAMRAADLIVVFVHIMLYLSV